MNPLEEEKRRTKYAWAQYFKILRNHHNDTTIIKQKVDNIISKYEIPEHIITELKSLLSECKKLTDCPICLNEIPSEHISISISCGHKYCNDCFSKITQCALCRTQINKK